MWFYYFPIRRQVNIRCPNGHDWSIYNEILLEAGIIHNATACSIASNEIRTLPELHGNSYKKFATPSLYLPDLSPILTVHEMPQLEGPFPTEARELDNFKARLKPRNGLMTWTRYFNYSKLHHFGRVSHMGI